MTEALSPARGQRKTKTGRVVSDKMDKTIVVSVERLARHRLYKRVVRVTTKFAAHDERNEARIGDTVQIEESRPMSATKRWRLTSVLSRAGEERAAESMVTDEAETSEAIHRSAHPGRHAEGREPAAEGSEPAAGDAAAGLAAGAEAEGDVPGSAQAEETQA